MKKYNITTTGLSSIRPASQGLRRQPPSSSTSKRQCHSQLRLWSSLAKSLDVYKICNRMGFRCFFLSKLSFCDKSLLLFFLWRCWRYRGVARIFIEFHPYCPYHPPHIFSQAEFLVLTHMAWQLFYSFKYQKVVVLLDDFRQNSSVFFWWSMNAYKVVPCHFG